MAPEQDGKMTESRGSQGGTAASSASRSLQPEALRRCCDPASLPFESTAELPDLDDAIGQVRAAEAVRFGIGIKRPGFNIFALGPSGVGKEHLVRRGLKTQAAREPVPDDWCYVNNFIDAHKPVAMRLPAGRAMPFRRDMERLVNELMVAIPAAFEGEEYRHRREVIEEELKQRQGTAFEALQRKALDKSVGLIRTPMGLALAPLKGGEVVKPEDFEKLDEAERTRIQSDIEALQGELQTLFRQIPVWERETREKLRALHRDVVS